VQLVFHKQVLPHDVSSMVTIGKYAAGLICNSDCANFAQKLLNRLFNQTKLLRHVIILQVLYKSSQTFVTICLWKEYNK